MTFGDIEVFDSYKESLNSRLQNSLNCWSRVLFLWTKFTVDVGVVVGLPKGPLSTQPKSLRVAKGLLSLLCWISRGWRASGTSLPINRPICASM